MWFNPESMTKHLSLASPHRVTIKSKFGISDYKFILLYNNRNIRRKMPGDVIMSYKYFMDTLTEDQRKECVLLFHTAPVDDNGTDLPEVYKNICPEYNVVFTDTILNDEDMNYLYNMQHNYFKFLSKKFLSAILGIRFSISLFA